MSEENSINRAKNREKTKEDIMEMLYFIISGFPPNSVETPKRNKQLWTLLIQEIRKALYISDKGYRDSALKQYNEIMSRITVLEKKIGGLESKPRWCACGDEILILGDKCETCKFLEEEGVESYFNKAEPPADIKICDLDGDFNCGAFQDQKADLIDEVIEDLKQIKERVKKTRTIRTEDIAPFIRKWQARRERK